MVKETGKTVKIKIVSSIIPTDGELEKYEMWLEGNFIEKGGSSYLRYKEVQDDLEIQTTVKLTENQSVIMRKGGVNMRLPLNLNRREDGHYESPMGSLPITTNTHQLSLEVNKDQQASGRFSTQYDLIIGGNSVGHYTLEIHYSEV